MLQLSKMFQPKTMHEMIMPLIVANFILGIGIWTSKRGRILNFTYSFFCLVSYCVLMMYSIDNMYIYYTQKSNQFGMLTFRAMFFANICSTLFLVPSGWLRKKVILKDYQFTKKCNTINLDVTRLTLYIIDIDFKSKIHLFLFNFKNLR